MVNGSAADLFTYNFSYEFRDPYFRGISTATRGGSSNNLGSGSETRQIAYGGTFNFHKFLPRSWNARLPITVGISETQTIPLLRTNSDVVLPDAVREEEKSVAKSLKFSVSESFGKKGSNILFSALLNRQKISFSYNRSDRRTVNNPFVFGESYNVRADYDMGIRKQVELPIFFWSKSLPLVKKLGESKLGLFPDRWTWNATYNRSLSTQDDKDYNRTSSFSRTFDGKMDLNYKMFKNLNIAYNFSTRRDLTEPDLVRISLKDPKLGIENSYNQSFRTSYDPKLFKFVTGSFNYTATYSDSWERSTETRNTTLSRSWGVSGTFRHLDLLGKPWSRQRRGTQRSRAGVRGGAREEADKEEKKEEEEDEPGPPIYEPVLAGLRFLTGWLNPVTYKYNEGFNQTVPGAVEKPAFMYRLGFETDPDFETGITTRTPRASENMAYDFGSGFSLLGGISTTVAYRTQVSRELINSGQERTETQSTSWPDVSLRISEFKTMPFIKPYLNWFIGVFSPRTAYSRQVSEARNIDAGFTINRTTTTSRNPVLSINFKVFRDLSMSGSYTTSEVYKEDWNRGTGLLQSEIRETKSSYAVTAKYSFSAPGGFRIPLFGKVKFKSTMSIDVNVKKSSDFKEKSEKGEPWRTFTEASVFSVSPRISYGFSQQIRGGLTGRWQDTNDKFNKKTHIRELQIWTEINF